MIREEEQLFFEDILSALELIWRRLLLMDPFHEFTDQNSAVHFVVLQSVIVAVNSVLKNTKQHLVFGLFQIYL